MNTIILPRKESMPVLDRPLKWRTVCLLILSVPFVLGATAEMAVDGIGEAESRHFVSQVRSIATWSTRVVEFADHHSTIMGAQ